jgi:hypothetical protein
MHLRWYIATIASMCAEIISPSLASPCWPDLVRAQTQIGDYLEAKAKAGPSARESVRARAHRQPTPATVAAAEEMLGEVDAAVFEMVAQAMVRARAAERSDDQRACEQALAEVKRLISPQTCERSICR